MPALDTVLQLFIGSRNERQVRTIKKEVAAINGLEPQFEKLSNDELRAKTAEFKHRIETALASGKTLAQALDDITYEAFAATREAARRTLGQRHFDVQLMGGLVLHRGSIAEMVTGEGKTLTATAPLYLNALAGRGVHVVTVNDYLARRDAEWMGNVFRMLGLTCGFIQSQMENRERRQMYACDITYGTNNEFGFDYLRDNMKVDPREQVQRGLYYAVVDEVDSILVDEARTPLIISGPARDFSELYKRADVVARQLEGVHDKKIKEELGKEAGDKAKYQAALEKFDFEIKEKEHQVVITDRGIERVERLLGIGHLYDARNQGWPHLIEQALRAHHLYKRDKNYVVHDGENGQEIVIVDEFTGRLQHGRRWSDGLHQAVEAKEGISVREESVTYATVTLQNYFKLYDKLAGMTGSAMTEAAEFDAIYKLDVVAIPTNRSLIRHDRDDLIYGSEGDKFQAAAAEVVCLHLAGRPVLLGTTSVIKSERLSDLLTRLSVRADGNKLSIRTPAFRLPAPGSGRKGGGDGEEIKVEPRVIELELLRNEGGLQIKLPDPSVRAINPKNDPNIETWFPVQPELAAKLAEPAGFIGIKHTVLNAKLHAKEAEIVAQAGNIGAVTIATNMAGRGTDIILGGNGEYHTKQFLKQQQNASVDAFLPDEFKGAPSFMVPRDVLLKAEKDYDDLVRKTFAEKFKAEFDAAHEKVVKLGGLAVIGTERHESRRIDNQLRGRCGRQGDPGSSQFFISLDDDLMRLFAGPRVRQMLTALGLRDGEVIQARMVTKSVARAQRKVEGHHFDIRKNLKEYDDVLDLQRRTFYSLRQSILEGVNRDKGAAIETEVRNFLNGLLGAGDEVNGDQAKKICDWIKEKHGVSWNAEKVAGQRRLIVRDNMILAAKLSKLPEGIEKMLDDRVFNVATRLVFENTPGDSSTTWNIEAIESEFKHIMGIEAGGKALPATSKAELEAAAEKLATTAFETKKKELVTAPDGAVNKERLVHLGRYFLLNAMDNKWREHLRNLEQLRYGIHWEAQAQKDPKVVYKKEGHALFERLLDDIDTEVVRNMFHVRIEGAQAAPAPRAAPAPAAVQPQGGNWANRSADIGKQAMEMAKQVNERMERDKAQLAPPQTGDGGQTGAQAGKKTPGPNDPCWCGSGKKYKKCHMAADSANVR